MYIQVPSLLSEGGPVLATDLLASNLEFNIKGVDFYQPNIIVPFISTQPSICFTTENCLTNAKKQKLHFLHMKLPNIPFIVFSSLCSLLNFLQFTIDFQSAKQSLGESSNYFCVLQISVSDHFYKILNIPFITFQIWFHKSLQLSFSLLVSVP